MCGIYTIGTTAAKTVSFSGGDFFSALDKVLSFEGKGRPSEQTVEASERMRTLCFELMHQGPQLQIFSDPALQKQCAEAAARINSWCAETEKRASGASHSQKEEETLNSLLIAARDTHWQLEHDLLANIDKIRALLGPRQPHGDAVPHAWSVNSILNNIDRLEVRGRDSAGVGIYIHFPDPESMTAFLTRRHVQAALKERDPGETFSDSAITLPEANGRALLFAFKTAEEVGEIGQNVLLLRNKIASDAVFQEAIREHGVQLNAIAHTRWASNGSISIANCHPVDGTICRDGRCDPSSRGNYIAALNGDIDNFHKLYEEILPKGCTVPGDVTTDAKLIPVMMSLLCSGGRSEEEAFNELIDRCEGSMAICLLSARRPGEVFLAQKGSGQGLFIGLAGQSVPAASEMYGIVELTDRYIKADGEKKKGGVTTGERFRVSFSGDSPEIRLLEGDTEEEVPEKRIGRAEITTRDIDRGTFPRYLLKEITESVASVRKTFRTKMTLTDDAATVQLASDALPPELLSRLKNGTINHIITMGQGTAAIAACGIAALLKRALPETGIIIESITATELSGHCLRNRMDDTLVIAVSQSGTTTDTNRTVDLVRDRGGFVTGIVNRRNSDLAYKADAVIYTSDGRDIEMSVASTKAFYAQNTAGQVLALTLAQSLETLKPHELRREITALNALPDAMQRTLAISPKVQEVARCFAPLRRYWAITGTGTGRIAADEIRIKLSELCYKAIAVDFLEDKKHIDLSSEPLIIVCAAGLSESQIPDAVKEVAIFKAHNSAPIVIVEETETRFDPYAAACIKIPHYEGALSFLLPTMIGHLFGYHAADTFEKTADAMRVMRKEVVRAATEVKEEDPGVHDPAELTPGTLLEETKKVQELISSGRCNSLLETDTAVKLNDIFNLLANRISLDALPHFFNLPGTLRNLLVLAEEHLSEAINQVSRPIDAIKHQAKTVTVGISRLDRPLEEGPIWELIRHLELPKENVPTRTAAFLTAFGRLLEDLPGATLYAIDKLNPLGQPVYDSCMKTVKQTGMSGGIASRYQEAKPLLGTKRQVVKEKRPYLGFGQKDQRRILILPFIGERTNGSLLLIHLKLREKGPFETRIRALKAYPGHYESLVSSVTERDIPWSDELIEQVDNATLFLKNPEETAARIARAHASSNEKKHQRSS